MKRIFYSAFFVLICTLTFCLASCNKATYLRADVETIEVESDGESNSIVLHSDGTDFQVLSSPEWVKAVLADSVLEYIASANEGTANREGEIVVACGEQRLALKVFQSLPATKLSVDPTSLVVPKEGGTLTVKVDTDASSPKVTAPQGYTTTYADGVLTIVATPEAAKEGTITLKAGKLEATIALSEKPDICSRCGGSGRVKCTKCGGEGVCWDANAHMWTCKQCDGIAEKDDFIPEHSIGTGKMKCPACGGSGK